MPARRLILQEKVELFPTRRTVRKAIHKARGLWGLEHLFAKQQTSICRLRHYYILFVQSILSHKPKDFKVSFKPFFFLLNYFPQFAPQSLNQTRNAGNFRIDARELCRRERQRWKPNSNLDRPGVKFTWATSLLAGARVRISRRMHSQQSHQGPSRGW